MIMQLLFISATAAAELMQFLDWRNTELGIAKFGLASEKNPIMRKLFGVSKCLALAYKLAPAAVIFGAAEFYFKDIQYFGMPYTNAPGIDTWAIAWILTQVAVAGAGLYGYIVSKKA